MPRTKLCFTYLLCTLAVLLFSIHIFWKSVPQLKTYKWISNVIITERLSTEKWCRLCTNYLQYHPIIQSQNIPKQNLDFVMFIPSQHGETSFKKRQFIRKFMLHGENSLNIKHVFILGK